jgi:hypothetical protein
MSWGAILAWLLPWAKKAAPYVGEAAKDYISKKLDERAKK